MCAITLTLIPACGDELPTIEYCDKVKDAAKAFENCSKIGERATPPKACTNSLGWSIFKSASAPVRCETCKAWLIEHNKRTYGGAASGVSKHDGFPQEQDLEEGGQAMDRMLEQMRKEQQRLGGFGRLGGWGQLGRRGGPRRMGGAAFR